MSARFQWSSAECMQRFHLWNSAFLYPKCIWLHPKILILVRSKFQIEQFKILKYSGEKKNSKIDLLIYLSTERQTLRSEGRINFWRTYEPLLLSFGLYDCVKNMILWLYDSHKDTSDRECIFCLTSFYVRLSTFTDIDHLSFHSFVVLVLFLRPIRLVVFEA